MKWQFSILHCRMIFPTFFPLFTRSAFEVDNRIKVTLRIMHQIRILILNFIVHIFNVFLCIYCIISINSFFWIADVSESSSDDDLIHKLSHDLEVRLAKLLIKWFLNTHYAILEGCAWIFLRHIVELQDILLFSVELRIHIDLFYGY